jgi:hypothetical protein
MIFGTVGWRDSGVIDAWTEDTVILLTWYITVKKKVCGSLEPKALYR